MPHVEHVVRVRDPREQCSGCVADSVESEVSGYDAHMGLLGDGYRATYNGHTIELIRDNRAKTLKLVIDGVEVVSQPRALQHDITLTATLVHDGVSHRVVARSIVGRTSSGTLMIDGAPLPIAKT